MMINKNCYLCNGEDFEELEGSVRDNPSLKILRCKNCSLVFLSSFNHICENFYENEGMHNGNCDIKNWLKQTKEDDFRRYEFLKKELKNKKVLDFGCGNGGFLRFAQKSASKTVGIEPQDSMQEEFKKQGICVFKDLDEVNEKFDIITMFHVLEHLKTPAEMLAQIAQKLDKNGQLIIEVPNADDALLTVYQNQAFMNFTYWSCHLYLFNEKTLTEVIEKAGLKINYIKRIQRYGFANHLWWQIAKKPAGHKKLRILNIKFINRWYEKSLAKIKATDTLIASVSTQ